MVQILLSHDKIQPGFSELSYAVLNYNVKVVNTLLDSKRNSKETIASKQQKNDLLLHVLNDYNQDAHGKMMHFFEFYVFVFLIHVEFYMQKCIKNV